MNIVLLAVIALFLFIVSYFLISKPQPFLSLLGDAPSNKHFLKKFGLLYIILGVLALLFSLLNSKWLTLGYLLILIIISTFFSLQFAAKMTPKNKA